MKPNIFELATTELTQDAFITWLLLYASPELSSYDARLNQCGQDFIKSMLQLQIPGFNEEITKVDAGRQFENIDIWAKVNDRYFIIIEDKVNTTHHSNQLSRYREIADKWCVEHKFEQPICIYLKTGNESKTNLEAIKQKGYGIFSRKTFLDILENYTDIKNEIFSDYVVRLSEIERSNTLYRSKDLGTWNGNDWQGFFQFLESDLGLINWNYVNNPNGGFWCAVLNWETWRQNPLYLQIEEGKLCFKVSTHIEDLTAPAETEKSETRNLIHKSIMNRAKEYGFAELRKPQRFGHGNYMTVAVVEKKDWLGEDDSKLNSLKVLSNLQKYKDFVRDMCRYELNLSRIVSAEL